MNLTGQAVYQKGEKTPPKPRKRIPRVSKKKAAHKASPEGQDDAAYISALHNLPCVICEVFGEIQQSRTTVHHWFSGRCSAVRTPNREALPFCDGHHQARWDKTKLAIHDGKETWAEKYGNDHEYIEVTQDRMERMMEGLQYD